MLEISLVAVGEKMPDWVQQGYEEYARRIRGRCVLKLVEVPAERRGKNADLEAVLSREAQKLQQAIPPGTRVIALDRGGRIHSTLELSRRMDSWLQEGVRVSILVGGPEGLDSGLINSADECWSLSALTFAHPLVRVVMAEQLYRCYSVLEGLPYHR